MPVLIVGNTEIPYEVRRSEMASRRRAYVSPDGVEVVVPTTCSEEQIADFVHRKRRWIFDETEIIKEKQAERHTISRFLTGAKIPYHGRRMKLTTEPTTGSLVEVSYKNGFFVEVPTTAPEHLRDTLIDEALRFWMKRQIRKDVRELILHYGTRYDLKPRSVHIKDQKHLWGSCGQDRSINLNWHLIFAPKPVLEYAVVHELCHLKHRNHNTPFWSLIGDILPNFETRKQWLRDNENLLSLEKIEIN